MRIAILHFGQPRFLNLTQDYIKEEFIIDGCEIDHFFHYWNDIGFNPADSVEKNYIKNPELLNIIHSFNPKMYMIETYDGKVVHSDKTSYHKAHPRSSLISLCESWSLIAKKFVGYSRKVPISTPDRLEYFFGQHYSMQSCFNLIQLYENLNNFKYDIIVKTRSDIVYKNKNMYKTEKQYNDVKKQYYTDLRSDIPAVKAGALRTNKWDSEKCCWSGSTLKSFHNGKGVRLVDGEEVFDTYEDIKIENENSQATRLCMNDWSLICNRQAAFFYFSRWFETYFITFGKNLLSNKTKNNWSGNSDHTLQGYIALYNNIHVKNHSRRDIKLILEGKTTATPGKIVIPKNNQDSFNIQEGIYSRYNK